jgi:hypothetical protein
MDKRQGIPQTILKILSQASTASQPRQRAFHKPAFGQHDKAFDLVTARDDLELELGADWGQGLRKLRPLLRPIRE